MPIFDKFCNIIIRNSHSERIFLFPLLPSLPHLALTIATTTLPLPLPLCLPLPLLLPRYRVIVTITVLPWPCYLYRVSITMLPLPCYHYYVTITMLTLPCYLVTVTLLPLPALFPSNPFLRPSFLLRDLRSVWRQFPPNLALLKILLKSLIRAPKRTNRAPVALFSRSGASRRRRSSTRKEFSKPKRQKAGGSSSSSSSSSDEEHFQKKKSRQMDKARMTMLPLNFRVLQPGFFCWSPFIIDEFDVGWGCRSWGKAWQSLGWDNFYEWGAGRIRTGKSACKEIVLKHVFQDTLRLLFHRFAFEPETQANSRAERDRIKREIENLEPYKIPDTDIEIDFETTISVLFEKP